MDEKKKKKLIEDSPGTDPEKIIKTTEADTENIVDFMHEEIKKRPVNRRKILQRARDTTAIAVLFGTVSCLVFAILLPVINNLLYQNENKTETVSLPEETVTEELTPEEMLENERLKEASEEKAWIREELDKILDEKIIGVEQQKRISSALQELAADRSSMVATVSGITSDMDWFNDSYENRNTASGLVTKKTDTTIYVLVQTRRIENAQRVIVTFKGGTEAEADIIGVDETTGLTELSVPLSAIPVKERANIEAAVLGSSAGQIITGAPVIAIGSPTGSPGSMTFGNVTGADGRLEVQDNELFRLTTDIYGSGDATGFLINLDGEVVGMIDMEYRDSDVPNMVCAVGISGLRRVILRLENGRKKAFLGLCGIDVTEEISRTNDIPTGIWVTRVTEDSPAMAAGIQKGDVIVGYDDTDITFMVNLITELEKTEPGQNAVLHIMRRKGGDYEKIKVDVETR